MTIEITREIAAKVVTYVNAGLVRGKGWQIPGQMCVEAVVCAAMGLPHSDEPPCVGPYLRSLKIRLNDSNWSSDAARAKGLLRLALAQLGSKDALDEKEFRRRINEMTIKTSVAEALRSAASVCKNDAHKAAMLKVAARCEAQGTKEAALEGKAAANAAATYAAANATANATAATAAYAYAAATATAAVNAAYAAYAADAAADAYAADAAANATANAAANATAATAAYARDESLAAYCERVVQILINMNAPGCQWLDLAPVAA